MNVRTAGQLLLAAANPRLSATLDGFSTARDALAAAPRAPRTVAVVGLTPGAGRTTAAALVARSVAGYSDRRVVVVDAATPPTAPRSGSGRPALTDRAARTVTALLGGDVGQGRLTGLLAAPATPGVARARLRASFTPSARPAVLSLPPGPAGFAPQLLEQTLTRLALRADLVVIDTPVGPGAPVLHAVVERVDHVLLVVDGAGDPGRAVALARDWLVAAPGRRRRRCATALVVGRGLTAPKVPATLGLPGADLPVLVLARDEALRGRRIHHSSRRSVITGLRLAAAVLRAD
jgi:hypothetical protein